MKDKIEELNVADLDWVKIRETLHRDGFVVVPEVLTAGQCAEMIAAYDRKPDRRRDLRPDLKDDLENDQRHDLKPDLKDDRKLDRKHDLDHDLKPDRKHDIEHDRKLDLERDLDHGLKPDRKHDIEHDQKPDRKHDLKPDGKHDRKHLYRKTVDMKRYRFGAGEYKYFAYPLPPLVEALRASVYPEIVPVANRWMVEMGMAVEFPLEHEALRRRCQAAGQHLPTALILRYGPGGFNTLHQDLYGEVFFPMQILFVLNEEGKDYTGGEFVITEQIPRAQSKANVLRPGRGDMVIFTTNARPVKGTRGYYRVTMKHGVSPLHSGVRHALGIIFHDALQ